MAVSLSTRAADKGKAKEKLSDTSTLAAESNASSSSSVSESDSESSSSSASSSSDSDSESELEEVSPEYLNSLIEKAKEDLRAKAQEKGKGRAFGDEDEIRLEDEQDDDSKCVSYECTVYHFSDRKPLSESYRNSNREAFRLGILTSKMTTRRNRLSYETSMRRGWLVSPRRPQLPLPLPPLRKLQRTGGS